MLRYTGQEAPVEHDLARTLHIVVLGSCGGGVRRRDAGVNQPVRRTRYQSLQLLEPLRPPHPAVYQRANCFRDLPTPEVLATPLPRTRVTRGCGPTTSSRHLRPFAGKQRGASYDSSGDGTTTNLALNYPEVKTQAGPDTRGTSARSTGRNYERAVRSSIRWGNSAVRDSIGCGDTLGWLQPSRAICREAAEQRSSRADRESSAKRIISRPTGLRHNLGARLRRGRHRGQMLRCL